MKLDSRAAWGKRKAGKVTHCLSSIIAKTILSASRTWNCYPLVSFWMSVILSQPAWMKDECLRELLNEISYVYFAIGQTGVIQNVGSGSSSSSQSFDLLSAPIRNDALPALSKLQEETPGNEGEGPSSSGSTISLVYRSALEELQSASSSSWFGRTQVTLLSASPLPSAPLPLSHTSKQSPFFSTVMQQEDHASSSSSSAPAIPSHNPIWMIFDIMCK